MFLGVRCLVVSLRLQYGMDSLLREQQGRLNKAKVRGKYPVVGT